MELEELKMERIDLSFISPEAFPLAGEISGKQTNHYLLMTTFGFLGSA